MKKIDENTKVTLTFEQLKKLVKEACKAPMWKKLDVELSRKAKRALTDESMSDEIEYGVESDADAAIEDLFDMYRACKVEPKVCNAITADGKKTSIFLDKGNSVGGIARALRDGRLLKVIGFN